MIALLTVDSPYDGNPSLYHLKQAETIHLQSSATQLHCILSISIIPTFSLPRLSALEYHPSLPHSLSSTHKQHQ